MLKLEQIGNAALRSLGVDPVEYARQQQERQIRYQTKIPENVRLTNADIV